MTAIHSCLSCSRHPSTHLPGGDDACPMCGLGEETEASTEPVPSPGPSLVCWETMPDGTAPVRLSFSIKVF